MSGLAFHQAGTGDAAAVTYNVVNALYGGELWNAEGPQDRRRHQRRRRQEGDGRPRQRDGPAHAQGLEQLVHRRGQRRDQPGQGLRRLPVDRRHRAACSIRRAPSSARPRKRSSRSWPSRRCPSRTPTRCRSAAWACTSRKYIPAEKQAEALNFIKWFQTPEAQKKWAQLGGVPARNDVLNSPEFLEAQPYNQVFTESVPRLKDFWNLPEYAKLLNVHSTAGQRGDLRHREARRGARQAGLRRAGDPRRERPLSSDLARGPGGSRGPAP